MNGEQVLKTFWASLKDDRKLLRQRNKRDALGQHTSDIRNAFCDYVEALRNRKVITDEIANSIKLD